MYSFFSNRKIENEEALCCDGTKALYYIEKVPQAEGWIIFLEGGGGCSTVDECNTRYNNNDTRILMTSNDYPDELDGKDLLSNDSSLNPLFHNYTRVMIPYCSQDAFLANSSVPEGVELGDPDNISFVFRGRVILQSVIKELLQDHGLGTSKRVVFAGSSAGGVGVVNNLEWIRSRLNTTGQAPELSLIIDSSWFIPFRGYHKINFSLEIVQFYDIDYPACMDHSLGFPCCTSLACLLTNDEYSQPLPPTFLITSLYDIFTLENSLTETVALLDFSGESEISDQDFLRIFNAYGTLMNSSVYETFRHDITPKVSVFAPSCTQHVFLTTSSLWDSDGLLNRTIDGSFQESVFELTNPVRSGIWDSVTVNTPHNGSVSLHQALQDWYADFDNKVFYADVCTGPACGVCPSSVNLVFSYDLWPEGAAIFVLVIASLMAAMPLLIKICLYGRMKYMLYRQRVYVYKMSKTVKNKPKFPKPVHAVSVSCAGLSYLLDTVDDTKKVDTDQTETVQVPTRHYRLSALCNTVMPCCKSLCHRYNAPVGDSETGQASMALSSLNGTGLRSDSGISSSIVSHTKTNSSEYIETTSMDLILDSQSPPTPVHKPPTKSRTLKKKVILRQVNMYINPGELMAIMGPSGSGKTTLLDVVLGRRRVGHVQVR